MNFHGKEQFDHRREGLEIRGMIIRAKTLLETLPPVDSMWTTDEKNSIRKTAPEILKLIGEAAAALLDSGEVADSVHDNAEIIVLLGRLSEYMREPKS